MRADDEIGENFLLAKISVYTVHAHVQPAPGTTDLEISLS